MNRRTIVLIAGIALAGVAITVCLVLGTLGWFAIGFGVMTACTNDYSCGSTGCSPCRVTGLWINVGGLSQLALAVSGVVGLVRGVRSRRGARLLAGGVALLAASAMVVVGTTWQAQASYCRPGTPGYAASYCDVDL